MAEIVFVQPTGSAPPAAFELLSHKLVCVRSADQAIGTAQNAVLVVVDARVELAAARNACLLLRAGSDWPILLLVDAAHLSVIGADWQADDFILPGASPAEFEARIRLLSQRRAATDLLRAGPIEIDEDGYLASVAGEQLDLTYTEFELLKYLVANPGRVLTREQLLSAVWGYDYYGGTRTVDVHVRRLRAKLGAEHDWLIGTVRNVGYRFSVGR